MIYLIFGLLLVLILLRIPVAFSMLFTCIVYLLLKPLSLDMVANAIAFGLNNKFALLAIPLFILAGNLMNVSGVTDRIFDFAKPVVGTLHGGLAHVNCVASLIFSGTSGAAMADIGGIGAVEIKAMTDVEYRRDFSAAVTVSSATVGPIFPPSIPLVIFAAVNEISALKLLVAGIIPGIVTTIFLMITVAILAKVRHYPRDTEMPALREIWVNLLKALQQSLGLCLHCWHLSF